MVKSLKIIFVLLLISFPLKAENINNIIINGNKRISDETIKIYGEIKNGDQYSQKTSNQILKNLYGTGFFENVEVTFDKNTLTINLAEYPSINQLVIIGEKAKKFKDEIKKIINLKERKPFVKSNLSKDIDIIKSFYSSLDQFCKSRGKDKN